MRVFTLDNEEEAKEEDDLKGRLKKEVKEVMKGRRNLEEERKRKEMIQKMRSGQISDKKESNK